MLTHSAIQLRDLIVELRHLSANERQHHLGGIGYRSIVGDGCKQFWR